MRYFGWTLFVIFSLSATSTAGERATWKAGVAKVNITPTEKMWMSGYASRNKPAEGTLHKLWAKALVIEDPTGKRAVLITLDLVGVTRELSLDVCRDLEKEFRLPRKAIVISTSHTHTGPVVRRNLNVMYDLDARQQKYVDDYGKALQTNIVSAVRQAWKNVAPAKLTWGIGKATFAVNRRNNPANEVPTRRKEGRLEGPYDHDAPVLAVHDSAGNLKAAVFGYACHATVLSFYQWSGDYPGFAQIHLEKMYPGAIALFWAGCGGDQNPLPRRTVTLADKYGRRLAVAVKKVIDGKMTPLAGPVKMAYKEIPLPLAMVPTRDKLAEDMLSKNRYVANRAKLLMKRMEKQGALARTYPYPVQTWRFGKLTWVVLGGEVVVDYAIRLKNEIDPKNTWVMGYANDVMAYIPSLRVLKEGGYEGATSMVYYGMPSVWSPRVEDMIVNAVRKQLK